MSKLVINNVYESITQLKHDKSIEFNDAGYVMLRPHQIVPKYYLMTSDDRHILILHYATGSGKTITALYCILDRLRISKMREFYPNFNTSKAIIIGEWFTANQFRIDMSRPMFKLANQALVESLKTATPKEAEEIEIKIQQSMNHIVSFYGYQAFFNFIFPHYAERHTQDVDVLIKDWKEDRLNVNEQAIETLKNNFIVIDEMQKLYSQHGLNTFGFTFAYLSRRCKELNLKLIYMTGTIFNSNISELASIINITQTTNTPLISASDICTTSKVFENMSLYQLKPNMKQQILKHLYDKYIYFIRVNEVTKSTKQSDTKNIPEIAKKLGAKTYITFENKNDNSRVHSMNSEVSNSNYPQEIIIGNTDISDRLTLFQIQASGYQLKALQNSTEIVDEDDEDAPYLSPFDAGLPPEREWRKYGISKDINGLYDGSFLEYKKIGQFCCNGKAVIDICLQNAFNREKTVLYHSKIVNFGLLQYSRILELNGFVHRGNEPTDSSICRNCKRSYKEHTSKCPRFEPIYFEYLQGQQKASERSRITDQIYNSPNNLYGELISVLLISDVAYAGVSLFSTNNLIILSRVPNMGRLRQIMSRIVRFRSHIALEKKVARFYILGAAESIDKKSSIYKYYKLRAMNELQIIDFVTYIRDKTIGHLMLNTPSKYQFTNEEKRLASKLVFDDGKAILESISNVVLRTMYMNWWRLDVLIERIRSNEIAISYLDLHMFPPEFIKRYLLDDNSLELFNLEEGDVTLKGMGTMIRNKNESSIVLERNNRLNFDEITADYNETIADYIDSLKTSTSVHSKRLSFMKLMELLTLINDYSYIIDNEDFWKYVYDIGYEYYEDDDKNFIKNHSSKGRDAKQMKGLYWNKRIIKIDGTPKPIELKFVYTIPHSKLNKVFHIRADMGLRLMIFDLKKKRESEDQRANQRGMDCWSRRFSDVSSYYKLDAKNTLVYCSNLITSLCDEQLKSKSVFMTTPFEKDMSM